MSCGASLAERHVTFDRPFDDYSLIDIYEKQMSTGKSLDASNT